MRQFYRALAIVGSMVCTAGAYAGPNVDVTFDKTAGFSDARDASGREDGNLKSLAAYLEQLGQQYLPSGQSLTITVLDIDLAGDVRPRGTRGELRVLKGGADWPRIKLRYSLRSGDQVIRSGEETIADMEYMQRTPIRNSSEPLYYEKRMLNDWFVSRLTGTGVAAKS